MRRLALTMALSSAALTSPAMARDHDWYFGVEGGALRTADTHFDLSLLRNNVRTSYANGVSVRQRTGIDADLIGGYDFGPFRAEAEIGYKRATLSRVRTSGGFGSTGTFDADGKVEALSSMVNLMADFSDGGWSGFVGGGAGVARVKFDITVPGIPGSGPNLIDKQSKFAWQIIAGARREIGPNVELGLKYRYFQVPRLTFNDASGSLGQYRTRFKSHSLLASLIFSFGAPPAAVVEVAPPPPPPPPAPATQTCADGSVILATDTCPSPPPPAPPPPPPPPRGERG